MKLAMVWNIPTSNAPLPYGAHIGTHSLASVCGLDVLVWANGDEPPAAVMDYDAFIVNLFGDMQHVTQIKAVNLGAKVIALPDGYFDDLFRQGNPRGFTFLAQLQAADMIGYVSESNRQFYGTLLNKPMIHIPHVIGTREFFEKARRQPKDNFLLTIDHIEHGGQRPLDYTVPNIATVAAIQRETGIRVIYVNAGAETREYARLIGLRADFRGYMVYADYVELAARALIGVDMYALHGFGRNEITLAYAGTPCIGSAYTDAGLLKFNPWQPEDAVIQAGFYMDATSDLYIETVRMGVDMVERKYSFESAFNQMCEVLRYVEQWH